MLVGKCPKCNTRYYGWLLKEPCKRVCVTCGGNLEVTDDSGNTVSGYSPFTREECQIKAINDVSSPEGCTKEEQD